MSRGTFALLAGLAFAMGVGVGAGVMWAAAPASVPPAPQVIVVRETAPVQPASADAGHENTGTTAPQESRRRPGLAAPVAAPVVARGTGRISGTVHDREGAPLVGVRLRATPLDWPEGASDLRRPRDENATLEEVVDWYSRWHGYRYAARTEVTTDTGGEFAFVGLADLRYDIDAFLDGYRIGTERGSIPGTKPDAELVLVGKPVTEVTIHVLRPDGSPAESAKVNFSSPSRGTSTRWSPDDVTIEIEPGTYEVRATTEGEPPMASGEVELVVTRGAATASVTLELAGRLGIRGKVHFPPGYVENSCRLVAIAYTGMAQPSRDSLRRARNRENVSIGRPDYDFTDLEPGTWYVAVLGRNYSELVSSTAVVVDEMVQLDFHVPESNPEDYAVVWVRGPDGELIEGAHFSVGVRSENGSSSSSTQSRLVANGSYLVAHHSPEADWAQDAGDLTHTMRVRKRDLGQVELDYERVPATVLNVQFDAPAKLAVTIAGAAGSGLEDRLDLTLWHESRPGTTTSTGPRTSSMAGEALHEFSALSPGSYEVELSLDTDEGEVELVRRPIQLTSGENRIELAIPVLHSLRVVTNLQAGDEIYLYRDTPGGHRRSGHPTELGADGVAVFDQLVAGEYKLAGHGGEMAVTVTGSATIVFEVEVERVLEVQLHGDGYLSSVGFENGDRIISVDGLQPPNAEGLREALRTAARERRTTNLTIRRAGTMLQLTIDPLRLVIADGDDLGGYLSGSVR